MTVPPNLLWTPEEEDELRLSILASKDIAAIAKKLNRTQTAIRRKAAKLKLPLKVVTVELGLRRNPKDDLEWLGRASLMSRLYCPTGENL
jgi:hypothetical protein